MFSNSFFFLCECVCCVYVGGKCTLLLVCCTILLHFFSLNICCFFSRHFPTHSSGMLSFVEVYHFTILITYKHRNSLPCFYFCFFFLWPLSGYAAVSDTVCVYVCCVCVLASRWCYAMLMQCKPRCVSWFGAMMMTMLGRG